MNGNPYFYHEITKRTVVGFGNLFNDIRIQKRNQSEQVINEMKVPLAYGPIQKFLARLTQMRELDQPVETTLPRLSFELTSWQYDGTRKEPPTQRFKTKEGETLKRVFLPVPYNLGFELNILSKLETDALQIVEQSFLISSHPLTSLLILLMLLVRRETFPSFSILLILLMIMKVIFPQGK